MNSRSDVNKGRLIAQIDADGNRTDFNHYVADRMSIITNRRGYITLYYYDERGNVTVKVDDDGATVYEYDQWDNLLSTMNPLGEMSYGTYDDRRNQLTQTDALGNTVSFTYNLRGQELTVTDARGNRFENVYDGAGNLLFVTDPQGNEAQQFISPKGLVLWRKDALGYYTTFTYDDNGRTLTESDALGNVTRYTYDANGNTKTESTTRMVDSVEVTETTGFEYDKLNRLIQTTDALGNITQVEYDALGNETARVDAKGYRTEFEYDAYRRLIKTTYPDGASETQAYDAEGNVISRTNADSHTTSYEYDSMNRQVAVHHPDGSITRTEYDVAGRVTSQTDALGNVSRSEYDAAGRRLKSIDALLNETEFEYNADGNLIKQTDANGHTVTYDYDELDRRIKTTFHDGSVTEQAYDTLGRNISKTDQSGRVTQYGYDALGRLISVTDALGQVTSYGYDERGNKIRQTDANNHSTYWSYDALGRVETRTLPMGQVESFGYDANGNMEAHTDFNGKTTTHSYDSRNRQVKVQYNYYMYIDTNYTASGQRKTHGGISDSYDAMGRLIKQTRIGNFRTEVMTYEYDANGNRTLMRAETTQSSVTTTSQTQYTFDVLNRLETVTDHNNAVTSYSYDAVGNRASVAYPNDTTTTYTYDVLNRLQQLQTQDASGSIISEFNYTLYPTGHRQSITDHRGSVSTYVYDDLYRLTQETIEHPVKGTVINSYTYDAVGNRLSSSENGINTSYSYDTNDRMTQGGTTSYNYDNNGNMTEQTVPSFDLYGFPTDVTTTYHYDDRNKLVSVTKPDPFVLQDPFNPFPGPVFEIQVARFNYDADGDRVSKTKYNDFGGSVETRYTVDKNLPYAQVVQEEKSQYNRTIYTYGDDLISQDRNAPYGSFLNYYNYDGLGSTRSLTDSGGSVTDTYDYNAYGTVLDKTGNSENSYLFTGEQYDAGLKQYYLRARYYSPGSGRFTQMDTYQGRMGEPVTLHKYLYGNGNPATYTDPSGNITIASLGTSITIVGSLTAVSNIGITYLGSQFVKEDRDSKPDAAIFTFGGSAGSGGAMVEGGGDVIVDFRTGKAWSYVAFGVGLSPISLFNRFKAAGSTKSVGLIWNFNNPNEWSGTAVTANWPVSIIHLLPASMFRGDKMWGAMTQLAKREKNVQRTDLTVQIGVSSTGPVALKISQRSNSFSASGGITSAPVQIPLEGFSQVARELAKDFGSSIDEF